MTPTQDIQGNSWTDEPEIPNTKREGNKPVKDPHAGSHPDPTQEPASQQRPPSDS